MRKVEVTASPTRNSLARDSTTSPTAPPSSGLPNSNGGTYDCPSFMRPRVYGVHRHEEVANQHLPILQRLQVGPHQGEVSNPARISWTFWREKYMIPSWPTIP